MMKKFFTLWACLFVALAVKAQGPNDSGTYYKNADGKSGQELKTALWNIIKNPSVVSYDGLINAYKKTDTRADGYVRDWYSNATNFRHDTDKAGSYQKEGDAYNREHSVPQSWFSSASPMKSDIVHVFPTDGYVNNRRSNYPFGEVGTVNYQSNNGYSKLGYSKVSGYSGLVFEPNDEVKGDIARIYFYMATCYEDKITNWSGESFTGNSSYQPFSQWTYNMMVRWSKLDPVDEVEVARNKAVYEVQKNRNPFVDYPGLEEYIWGTKKNTTFSYDNYDDSGTPDIITVEQPVFSPAGGTYTNQVVVSISTPTDGATIYYTTNNADASPQGKVYSGSLTLTESTTLKAIAVKDGTSSYQTIATYTITDGQGGETPAGSLIAFGNQLFGTTFSGSLTGGDLGDYSGTVNGVTVTYSKGEGVNQYINDKQIRLYQKNKLVISVNEGSMTSLEFQLAEESSKQLQASTGQVADLTWTGSAKSVTFNVNDGKGNMQLSGVKVTLDPVTQGISSPKTGSRTDRSFRTLSGLRVDGNSLHPGIYIHNGKKIIIK